jgi:hypothetical protein
MPPRRLKPPEVISSLRVKLHLLTNAFDTNADDPAKLFSQLLANHQRQKGKVTEIELR